MLRIKKEKQGEFLSKATVLGFSQVNVEGFRLAKHDVHSLLVIDEDNGKYYLYADIEMDDESALDFLYDLIMQGYIEKEDDYERK